MTDASRKASERARKRESGLVPVEVWVPRDKADEIRQIARGMIKAQDNPERTGGER
jgi:hypothetical protein